MFLKLLNDNKIKLTIKWTQKYIENTLYIAPKPYFWIKIKRSMSNPKTSHCFSILLFWPDEHTEPFKWENRTSQILLENIPIVVKK